MAHSLLLFAQTTYTYTTTTTESAEAPVGVAIGLFLGSLVVYALFAWVLSRIFVKANRKGWPAWVPIYNSWVLFEIAGKPGWWVLLNFIPFVGSLIYFVLLIIASVEIAKRFGKGTAFAIFGLIIFSIVGYIMLAFGKAEYNDGGISPSSTTDQTLDTPYPQTPQSFQQASVAVPAQPVASAPLEQPPASNAAQSQQPLQPAVPTVPQSPTFTPQDTYNQPQPPQQPEA